MQRPNSFENTLMLGKDWSREEKGTTEDEVVVWHHRLNGHEFEETLGVGDGQGGLVCCSPWGHKELDTTEWLNWTKLKDRHSKASSLLHKIIHMDTSLQTLLIKLSGDGLMECAQRSRDEETLLWHFWYGVLNSSWPILTWLRKSQTDQSPPWLWRQTTSCG